MAQVDPISDLIDPFPAKGSVIIDGKTSYSGVDIKVVVHMYDGGKVAAHRKDYLKEHITNLDKQQTATSIKISSLESQLQSSSITPNQLGELQNLQKGQIIRSNTMSAISDEIARLEQLRPEYSTKVLAELQTISVQSHRTKVPVRAFGSNYVKGYARSARSIAGSMIFTVFDRDVFEEFLEADASDFDVNKTASTAILDQIPPVDITIAFANELGQVSRMVIYGVEFINQGQTMSIEDLLLENVVQYVARDIDPMRAVAHRKFDEGQRLSGELIPTTGSQLLLDDDYMEYKEQLSPYGRRKSRQDPFI